MSSRPHLAVAAVSDDLATIAKGLVHALRNPLFSAKLDLHTLRNAAKRLTDARGLQELATLARHCERELDCVESFLVDLVEYACPAPARCERLDLRDHLHDALSAWRASTGADVRIVEQSNAPLWVFLDPARLKQILSYLLSAATLEDSPAQVLHVQSSAREEEITLLIANPSWILSEGERGSVFGPFARIGKREPRLRLATAQRFVGEAAGKLSCDAEFSACINFRLALPPYCCVTSLGSHEE